LRGVVSALTCKIQNHHRKTFAPSKACCQPSCLLFFDSGMLYQKLHMQDLGYNSLSNLLANKFAAKSFVNCMVWFFL
jgi:hypothetical protein